GFSFFTRGVTLTPHQSSANLSYRTRTIIMMIAPMSKSNIEASLRGDNKYHDEAHNTINTTMTPHIECESPQGDIARNLSTRAGLSTAPTYPAPQPTRSSLSRLFS